MLCMSSFDTLLDVISFQRFCLIWILLLCSNHRGRLTWMYSGRWGWENKKSFRLRIQTCSESLEVFFVWLITIIPSVHKYKNYKISCEYPRQFEKKSNTKQECSSSLLQLNLKILRDRTPRFRLSHELVALLSTSKWKIPTHYWWKCKNPLKMIKSC